MDEFLSIDYNGQPSFKWQLSKGHNQTWKFYLINEKLRYQHYYYWQVRVPMRHLYHQRTPCNLCGTGFSLPNSRLDHRCAVGTFLIANHHLLQHNRRALRLNKRRKRHEEATSLFGGTKKPPLLAAKYNVTMQIGNGTGKPPLIPPRSGGRGAWWLLV